MSGLESLFLVLKNGYVRKKLITSLRYNPGKKYYLSMFKFFKRYSLILFFYFKVGRFYLRLNYVGSRPVINSVRIVSTLSTKYFLTHRTFSQLIYMNFSAMFLFLVTSGLVSTHDTTLFRKRSGVLLFGVVYFFFDFFLFYT